MPLTDQQRTKIRAAIHHQAVILRQEVERLNTLCELIDRNPLVADAIQLYTGVVMEDDQPTPAAKPRIVVN